MYYYKLFGLTAKSEFEIPEAIAIEPMEHTDLTIELGMPPKEDFDLAHTTDQFERLEKEVAWFNLPGRGMFYVENGSHIIIWKETEELTDLARNSYLTGNVMGLVMFQRGIIPIHSGGVAWNDSGILVLGVSGAGKSTNSVMLRNKGCDFITDDMAPITIEDGVVMVSPSFPQQKLCRDAALRQGYQLEDLIYIDEDRDKFAIRLKDRYVEEKLPLAMIVELETSEETELVIEEKRGLEKLKVLFRNVYRGEVLNKMGLGPQLQMDFLKIAEQVPIYHVMRPNVGYHADAITDWILEQVKK